MKTKQLGSLAVLAIVVVGVAIWSSRTQTQRSASLPVGKTLLPELEGRLNDVARIRVESPAGTTSVERVQAVWSVPGRYNYPADFARIRGFLTRLADLKILQAMRASPGLLVDLQLLPTAEATAKGNQATRLTLEDKDGKVIATLRAGKNRLRPAPEQGAAMGDMGGFPDSRFVMVDKDRVCLVGDTLADLSVNRREWLSSDFVSINSSDLASITISGGTNGDVTLERPSSGNELTLKDIPKDHEVDSAKLNQVTSILSYLRFDDVADPKLSPEKTGLDKPVTFKARTAKGEVYTIRVGKTPPGDTRRYISVAVACELPPLAAPVGTNQTAVVKAQAEETAKREADAKELNDKVNSWVYLIGPNEAESLTISRASLLKAKTPETPKK